MNNFKTNLKKAKDLDVFNHYKNAHVLGYAVIMTLLLGFSRKSLEIVRLAVDNKRLKKIRKKYKNVITQFKKEYASTQHSRDSSNIIWVLWLQGLGNAPDIVKICYRSLKMNLTGKKVVLLTQKNYKNYVKFPKDIQEKIDSGIINRTAMSDLLRLELLISYGGTWIDATVWCSSHNIPNYMLKSDLFVFQNLKPGRDGHSTIISSWFMTASTNNPILLLTRNLLYDYWRKNSGLIDYFILHDMFQLAIEAYPDEWKKVVPFSNATPHIILLRLFDQLNLIHWNAIKEQTPFHKLSYKFNADQFNKDNTYYKQIIKETENGNGGYSDN